MEDELVLACRPVRVEDYPPERREAVRKVSGWEDLAIYPGSEFVECQACGIEVAVGPRQQETRNMAGILRRTVRVLCMIDAALYANEHQGETALGHLGNPFKRAD